MEEDDFDPEELRRLPPAEQSEIMERWFRSRFENPAEQTPHDSEDGYIYIWGGPFSADEELQGRFEGIVPDEVINELAQELEGECFEWSRIPGPEDFDQGLYEAVSANAAARQTLDDATTTIRQLLDLEIAEPLADAFRRLLYANAIAALETYLSDTFINAVLPDTQLLQRYVDTDPRFAERKVAYKDVVREAARLEIEARNELLDVVWHNLAKVKAMYAQVLRVDFGDVGVIGKAIQIRHDIVHRNGRRKDGELVQVGRADIHALLSAIIGLASVVELRIDFDLDMTDFEGVDF